LTLIFAHERMVLITSYRVNSIRYA